MSGWPDPGGAADEAGKDVSDAANKAEKAASEAADKAEKAAEEAKDKAEAEAKKAEDAAKDAAKKAQDEAKKAQKEAEEIKDKAEAEVKKAEDEAKAAEKKAEQAIGDARKKAEQAAEEAKQKAEEVEKEAKKAIADAEKKAEEAEKKAKQALADVEKKARELEDEAKKLADEAEDMARKKADELAKKADELAKQGNKLLNDAMAKEKALMAMMAAAEAHAEQELKDLADGANALMSRAESLLGKGEKIADAMFNEGAMALAGAGAKAGQLMDEVKNLDDCIPKDAADRAQDALADPAMRVLDTTCEVLPCGRVVTKSTAKTVAAAAAPVAEATEAEINARKATAMDYFTKEMKLSEPEANQLMKGLDFTKPVEVVDVPPPETMSQYVRKSWGQPGNWFNPDPSQTADMLGLNGDPLIRELKEFKTPPGKVLKSYAAPIVDDWTDKGKAVMTKGGGIQMTVTDAMKNAFKAVK